MGKSIDTVATFDNYAVKTLEKIDSRQRTQLALPWRALSAIRPLAALDLARQTPTEGELKHLFITTATRISGKVKILIDNSFELGHDIDKIQEVLDRIKELAVDEIGDLPREDVLGALWAQLTRPDDHELLRSHKRLLTDISDFYQSSSSVMRETTGALNRVEAELEEFREDFATAGLLPNEYPLEVIMALFKKSAERLEAGRKGLEFVEARDRPQVGQIG